MDNNEFIGKHRINYGEATSSAEIQGGNPFEVFGEWLDIAINSGIGEPHAMNLASVGMDYHVSSRIVLLRDYSKRGFTFYTNYHSKKSHHIEATKFCALNFFWQPLEKQVRIEGKAEKLEAAQSDSYFASRPRESQIGAWASSQSEALQHPMHLQDAVSKYTQQFAGQDVPRPPHWGGWCVVPHYFEFWQGQPNRLHRRVAFSLNNGDWVKTFLQP